MQFLLTYRSRILTIFNLKHHRAIYRIRYWIHQVIEILAEELTDKNKAQVVSKVNGVVTIFYLFHGTTKSLERRRVYLLPVDTSVLDLVEQLKIQVVKFEINQVCCMSMPMRT